MPSTFDVGQTIASKYELVRLIGRGETSSVWEAKHTTLDETFALKVLTPAPDVTPEEASARFQEQAKLSAALSKKTRHVVSVTDSGEEDGWPYVVMELLEGETLETRLRRGTIDAAEIADMVGQVARALTVAHAQGLVHGNLVPANLFLCTDEDGRVLVKLLDFGFALAPGAEGGSSSEALGDEDLSEASDDDATGPDVQRYAATTSPYASPEQVRGEKGIDYRADLWALVVIAYRCLVGTLPWQGESAEEIVVAVCTHQWVPARERKPSVPYVVEAFFARGFALELDERFKTAKELAATFRAGFPHTERAAGGRAAFASRPSFDEELGAAPRKDTSSSRLVAEAPAVTAVKIEEAADDAIAKDPPRALMASIAETPALVDPAPPPANSKKMLGLALAALAILLVAIAAWAASAPK